MASFTGHVITGIDDYEVGYNATSSNTTISAYDFNQGGSNRQAYAKIDTSGLDSTAIISQVNLVYYHHSYVKVGKSTTYNRTINVYHQGATGVTQVYLSTATPPSTPGWQTLSITNSSILADITAAHIADSELRFRWSVGTAEATGSRNWIIRAYEYSGSYSAYVVITYTLPSSTRRRVIVIS